MANSGKLQIIIYKEKDAKNVQGKMQINIELLTLTNL